MKFVCFCYLDVQNWEAKWGDGDRRPLREIRTVQDLSGTVRESEKRRSVS